MTRPATDQRVITQHLDRLNQRRIYLDNRIASKRAAFWEETEYDEVERDALVWALSILTAKKAGSV